MHQLPRGPSRTSRPTAPSVDRSEPTGELRDRYVEPGQGSRTGQRGEDADSVEKDRASQRLVMAGHSREAVTKLNQIVQNYFIKAALILIQSRMFCAPSYNKGTGVKRVNKWFNVEIDETDLFREDWRIWKICDAESNRPPPMIIETYLDMAALTRSQSLVLVDDQGKRWNVDEALNSSLSSSLGKSSVHARRTRVVLERWTVQLNQAPNEQPADLNAVLPVVYKKSIVLFRSLYTYSKFLPAWKFARQLGRLRVNHSALQVKCRIFSQDGAEGQTNFDALTLPLADVKGRVTEDFSFGSTDSPAGSFCVSVSYRNNCEFRVDDSESLLSSHFMGMDEHLFRPSLGIPEDQEPVLVSPGLKEVGSLPPERREVIEPPDRSQAYGSMSTFHQVGPPTGSSPLTALRTARELGLETSPSSSSPRPPPNPRSTQSSKSSLRSTESPAGMQRRPSVSFMPFKTPSLSASPSPGGQFPPSPRIPAGKTPLVSALTQARNRTSMEPHSPSSLKGIPAPVEHPTGAPGYPTARPASVSRYSSSFGHRRGRLSSGGASKTDDDNHSSGRASQASLHAQPGSGTLAEGGTGGSSGSIQTDDDNISDFLKLLDTKKNLKSFDTPGNPAGVDASSKRTSAALSKFQKMRDSHAALSDSLSSSLILQRSSSTSSRQLSSVPPMVAGTSLSPSSSPGKPISPHTPHTPAVPSRLSAHSVAVYAQPHRSSNRNDRSAMEREERLSGRQGTRREDSRLTTGSNAIDIPSSPRRIQMQDRRSSSVAQRQRAMAIEDDTGDLYPFGLRSASVGTQDRPPLSLSALLGLQEASETAASPSEPVHAPSGSREDRSESASRQDSPSSQLPSTSRAAIGSPYRPRLGRTGTRDATPPSDSFSGYAGGRGSGSGTPERPASTRYSFSRPGTYDEDEPLLFAMSEISGPSGPSSRRSLEEGRGGSQMGSGERGAGDLSSHSTRGSRRGGVGPW
ncbi:MAG: autophagy protein 13 [Peltula sp. TS41687]|nr:MAG: autophagy protein 13 [Peltula sp. TS41687]